MIAFFIISFILSLLFAYILAKNINKQKAVFIGVLVFFILFGTFLSIYVYYGTRVPEGTTPFTPEEIANPISLE